MGCGRGGGGVAGNETRISLHRGAPPRLLPGYPSAPNPLSQEKLLVWAGLAVLGWPGLALCSQAPQCPRVSPRGLDYSGPAFVLLIPPPSPQSRASSAGERRRGVLPLNHPKPGTWRAEPEELPVSRSRLHLRAPRQLFSAACNSLRLRPHHWVPGGHGRPEDKQPLVPASGGAAAPCCSSPPHGMGTNPLV